MRLACLVAAIELAFAQSMKAGSSSVMLDAKPDGQEVRTLGGVVNVMHFAGHISESDQVTKRAANGSDLFHVIRSFHVYARPSALSFACCVRHASIFASAAIINQRIASSSSIA